MKIGILSAAHMHATEYVRALKSIPGIDYIAVYDHDEGRGTEFAAVHHLEFQRDMDSVLAAVDAVIVCAENIFHRQYVERAARAGKPILCEKPLATTAEDAITMVSTCRSYRVPLYMALPARYLPAVRQLKDVIQRAELGQIVAINGTNHGFLPPGWFVDASLSGGGAVMDHTVHVLDLMRWFLQSEVTEIYAEIDHRIHNAGIDDSAILTMQFANGVFATLDPSWSRLDIYPTWGDVTLEIIAAGGIATVDGFAEYVDVYVPDGKAAHRYSYYGENMNLSLIKDFIDGVDTGHQSALLATGVDGVRALEVTLAAYRSAQTHQPVALSPASFPS